MVTPIIITDLKNNIIFNTTDTLFLQLSVSLIKIEPFKKLLLANLFDKNYILSKFPIELIEKEYFCWTFEQWKMHNIPFHENKTIRIYNHLKNPDNFSNFEQEIIYGLLIGYKEDKEIEQFLENNTNQKIKGNIKYTISVLFDKFSCHNRTDLISALLAHEFHTRLPKTLFPKGEYFLN